MSRFSDEYDPEPDYDRPTRAEAEADEAGMSEPDEEWLASDERKEMLSEIEVAEATHCTCVTDGPNDPACPVCFPDRERHDRDHVALLPGCPYCLVDYPPSKS